MSKTEMILGRQVTTEDNGSIAIDKTNYQRYLGGGLKLARSFGYMYEWEVLTLQVFVHSLPLNAKIVNLGSGAGTSALSMVEARMDLVHNIYSVDNRDDGGPFGGLIPEQNAFRQYNTPIVNQILGDSYQVGIAWDNGPLDLVFVDAAHSGYGVQRDIEAWLPHIKDGGFMLFHDYNHSCWPEVKPTVDRLMKDHELIMVIDLLAVFRVHKSQALVSTEGLVQLADTPIAKPKRTRKPKEIKELDEPNDHNDRPGND